MKRAAALGLLVAVHAETDAMNSSEGHAIREYLASRPVASEVAAIEAACEITGETGCALQIVHVSSAAGVAAAAHAAAVGVDVTCETCPYYLFLNKVDVERLGAVAKCARPIRSETQRTALLDCVRNGNIHTIGSDHSPAHASMKQDLNFLSIWGGISGVQHLLPVLLELGLGSELISRLTSANVAKRFGISANKGQIGIGFDADLTLVDRSTVDTVGPLCFIDTSKVLTLGLNFRHAWLNITARHHRVGCCAWIFRSARSACPSIARAYADG